MAPEESTKKYLAKTRRFASVFAVMPFVQCLILTGSVAIGSANEKSDIDILVIAKSGRIFTARFFLLILTKLLGAKRSKNPTVNHAGKFCFNHFITDKSFRITTGRGEGNDRYCATSLGRAVLILGNPVIFNRFLKANQIWMDGYINQKEIAHDQPGFPVTPSPLALSFKMMLEKSLSGRIGVWLERQLRAIQSRSIMAGLTNETARKLVICSDKELRFYLPK